ncbi:SDR family NAD(P)-dependent oxidoreductase [Alkalihalobacillus sp. LMS39]|uniref:SDR family NAD(P)-dependent oxidoreductase n=1 Tax=Alkalihalobacillus sp. LMS39 TaxID=2924032 RepID=UPI001FB2E441|nr:SDR family NAD(P)-dependent oxidoreductase [Alkalihalobacillus sp. LMS39]UOE95651.1 SDR family oxidoreductase [Alkalihalobacillus sp. LMS39]
MRLEGKVAIITGASSGIGRATAFRFAEEGAKLMLTDIKVDEGVELQQTLTSAGYDAIFVKADVTNETEIEHVVNETVSHFGRINILFNNAGIGNEEKRLIDMKSDEWDKVINVNLKSIFLGMKHVIPEMLKHTGGSIINTSSLLGIKGKKYVAPYNASKAGVITLTKNAALEYGQQNIRVNAIAPGVIDTPIIDEWKKHPEKWNIISKANALRRLGTPTEVANVVVFLASEEASFITGTTIMVDGGGLTF